MTSLDMGQMRGLRRFWNMHRPRKFWSNLHWWSGYALIIVTSAGAGNILATTEFKITDLWSTNARQAVEIHQLKALVPKGAGTKTEAPTTVPACVPVHPQPAPPP